MRRVIPARPPDFISGNWVYWWDEMTAIYGRVGEYGKIELFYALTPDNLEWTNNGLFITLGDERRWYAGVAAEFAYMGWLAEKEIFG
jgi:hypothetical protein